MSIPSLVRIGSDAYATIASFRTFIAASWNSLGGRGCLSREAAQPTERRRKRRERINFIFF